jgi:hydrogenase-1 operon protein HyaE
MAKFTQVAAIDPETHPGFRRLFDKEGFKKLTEDGLDAMLEEVGMKMVVFADDPNKMKETLDIVIIAPEIAKAFGNRLAGCWMSDTSTGRALASRFGFRRLPAVALFKNEVCLGAAEGLMNWDDYIKTLAEIGSRQTAPKRTIAILAGSSKEN